MNDSYSMLCITVCVCNHLKNEMNIFWSHVGRPRAAVDRAFLVFFVRFVVAILHNSTQLERDGEVRAIQWVTPDERMVPPHPGITLEMRTITVETRVRVCKLSNRSTKLFFFIWISMVLWSDRCFLFALCCLLDIETVPPDLLTLTSACVKLRMTQQPPLHSSNAGTTSVLFSSPQNHILFLK